MATARRLLDNFGDIASGLRFDAVKKPLDGAFEEDGCRFADLEKVHIVAVQVRGMRGDASEGRKGGRAGEGRGAFKEDGCRFADLEKVHIVAVQVRGREGRGKGGKKEGKHEQGRGACEQDGCKLLIWKKSTLWRYR